jgi:hypothetical protein
VERKIAEEIMADAKTMFECINRLTATTMRIEDEQNRTTVRRAIARIIAELDDGVVRSVTKHFPDLDLT